MMQANYTKYPNEIPLADSRFRILCELIREVAETEVKSVLAAVPRLTRDPSWQKQIRRQLLMARLAKRRDSR